jgi:hypothetical protein
MYSNKAYLVNSFLENYYKVYSVNLINDLDNSSYSEIATSYVYTLPLIMLTVIIIILVIAAHFMDNEGASDETDNYNTGNNSRNGNHIKIRVIAKVSHLYFYNALHRRRNSVHGPNSILNSGELYYLASHCGILGAHVSPNFTIHRNGRQLIPTRRDIYNIIRYYPTV